MDANCPHFWWRAGEPEPGFVCNTSWHAEGEYTRTFSRTPKALRIRRSDTPIIKPKKIFRNPLVYGMELNDELVRDNLTRKQLAERHGITSDRVTQWLRLLKLPNKTKERVIALGDNWSRKIITERELRKLPRS